jgi:hypothetical protein
MVFWKKKQKLIDVTFYEGARGDESTQPIAQVAQQVEQLPETFAVATQLQIGDDEWQVLEAVPAHRRDFEKSGRLDVYVARVESVDPGEVGFTQLDITEEFGVPPGASRDDWIETSPINTQAGAEGVRGLPPLTADNDEVYAAAVELSAIREEVGVEGDGVYCPTCHIANVDFARLHEPCPRCSRGLLAFGWT